MVATVEDEYKKNKELRADDMKALQEWVRKQPHLPHVSDFQLALFLHSCHFSMEQAKVTIEKFFTYRGAWGDFFANRDPRDPKLQNDMKVSLCSFLPERTPENYKLLYFKLVDVDVNKYAVSDCVKLFDMAISLEFMERGSFDGLVIVVDLKAFTVGHVLKTHITTMKRILLYVQEAIPIRLKGLHYITLASVCDLLVPLVKPFMKKELAHLLHFHDSYETLSKFVPHELLPEDYGGKAPSVKELHAKMQESFTENADFFLDEEMLVSNEKLRDRKQSYMDRDLGIGTDGSFKKLDFD
ncbi:hypothetical protein PPYR_03170 [Photinus pyralis]|uniref:CRAL-TRIO domain-containing protein n=2 Tax=Photinus pyralis TaxID=7054 RepID=A0A5N4A214_PHOPY|nr:alpha-tocopherol transfer protein-like [Photinus pyralis]KAB0791370.1 hypothetical protein PPYR_03170 [Photinus pyralis]